jgi:uncharacterized CHY-type Zn-finger protein
MNEYDLNPWASVNTGPYQCEMCGKDMSQKDYDYCDICPNCLDEEGGGWI